MIQPKDREYLTQIRQSIIEQRILQDLIFLMCRHDLAGLTHLLDSFDSEAGGPQLSLWIRLNELLEKSRTGSLEQQNLLTRKPTSRFTSKRHL